MATASTATSTQGRSGTDGLTSASPPGRPPLPSHTRTYQACIPCRRRKVRCDLGPVDNPHDPPCVRCRRESKECFFSATRRKRRTADGVDGVDDGELSDYEIRNGRKRARAGSDIADAIHPDMIRSVPLPDLRAPSGAGSQQQPLTPGGSIGRLQPLRRPGSRNSSEYDEEDQQVNNEATKIMQKGEVFSGHDALNLLFEAAGRNGDILHQRTGSSGSFPRPNFTGNTPGSQVSMMSPHQNIQGREPVYFGREPASGAPVPIDPAVSQSYARGTGGLQEDPNYEDALRAWSKFRFVRAGWFTAKEGVEYVDYFYSRLSPLTPLIVPDYRAHSKHAALLAEEPMLVITLLTISSRYMELSGPGGVSRPFAIHARLWKYLQGMIGRLIFAQEQFGGGFCGAGAPPGNVTNHFTRRGLRTLGTIESLMILTEWHPRALHFPPGDDNELVLPDELPLFSFDSSPSAFNSSVNPKGGYYGRRIESCLEPCWRSDRMCWMLLGVAMSLAFELGVFDDVEESDLQQENREIPVYSIRQYLQRKEQLKDLLLVYITQTSGRLGFTSMLSKVYTESLFSKTPEERLVERFEKLRLRGSVNLNSLAEHIPPSAAVLQNHMSVQELVLYFWIEIAALMEMGNKQLFPSRKYTRDIIATDRYVQILQGFQPILRKWRKAFDECYAIPKHMRDILAIEYEYCRVYINSVALQAVVERCANNTPAQTKTDGEAIPFSTLMRWYGNDRPYIWEVIDASRKVLQVIVNDLYPNDYLKHAPVRTYFRIISVAIILLKTFALGASEKDVAISLGLMDGAIQALRTCIVDDVHVGVRFAELLDTLANRIRSSFVRMAPKGGIAVSRGASPGIQPNFQPQMGPPSVPGHLGPSQWSGFNPSSPSLTGGRATPTNPLYGISTESYDPGSSNISIMPPPTFAANGAFDGSLMGNGANSLGPPGMDEASLYMHDWLALPLDPLLNTYGVDVNQTTHGPDVGGLDLLDILLSGMNGSTPTN